MKQLNHFDRIHAYAEGQMDAAKRTAFEADLSANEELRTEYEAFLVSQKALEVLAFDELANILNEQPKPTAKTTKVVPLWKKAWARAAAVLVLVAAGLFWYANQQYSNEQLSADFYLEPNFSPSRSENNLRPFATAATSFEMGNLEKAIQLAEPIPANSIDYENAQYLLGHAYFKNGRYAAAVKHFENVKKGEYASSANFMRGYSLLLAGQKEEALQVLNNIANNKHPYSEKAKALLAKDSSFWRGLVF